MRKRSILSRPEIFLLASAAVIGSINAAQAQDGGNATVLERLTVEAESDDILVQDGYVAIRDRIGTKVDTPIVQIPQAISVITQDQIEDQKPRTLNEALGYTASANPNNYGFDARYDAYFLRGFPALYNSMFRDGLRQYNGPSAWFKTEPYGIEGVTILKGPASSLYGISGPGGIVNIVTKRPKDEQFREIEILGGTDNRYQAAFDLSGPANEDGTLLYRLTGLGRESDTWLPGFPDDKLYLAPAFTWKPDEDTKLTVLSEISHSVTGGTSYFFDPSRRGQTNIPYVADPQWNDFDQTQGRVGYEFEHRFNEVVTVRQNLRYNAIDADIQYSYVPWSIWGHYKENLQSFVVDNMAQFEFDTGPVNHTAAAGLDYAWSKYDAELIEMGSLEEIRAAPLPPFGSQEMNQLGIYAHDQIEWDDLTLFASGRYDWVDTSSTDDTLVSSEQKDSAFSGRFGISYRTDWGIIPYANYSTSFAPNIAFVCENAACTEKHAAKPTRATQKEIGIKYEIPDYNAVISAAYFDIDQEDGNVFDSSGSGLQRQLQYNMNSRGFELEANASLINGLSLIASYTHLRVEIEQGPVGTVGKELSGAPNDVFSLWGHYKFEGGPLAGLGLGAGVRYVGESFGDDQNTFKNEARTFVDAALSYDFGYLKPEMEGVMLQVNAKNLFDEQEPVCTSGTCYLDEGRSVFASLRYRF